MRDNDTWRDSAESEVRDGSEVAYINKPFLRNSQCTLFWSKCSEHANTSRDTNSGFGVPKLLKDAHNSFLVLAWNFVIFGYVVPCGTKLKVISCLADLFLLVTNL